MKRRLAREISTDAGLPTEEETQPSPDVGSTGSPLDLALPLDSLRAPPLSAAAPSGELDTSVMD